MARETAAEKADREAAEQASAAVDAAAGQVEVDEGAKIRVPVEVGDRISFSRGGEVVAEFAVKDGVVTARDGHERQLLLDNVAGAELVEG